MKNILFVSYDGLTDQLGQSQILPYIISLTAQGYSFSIISFEKEDALYSKSEIQEIADANNISWYPLSYTKRPPVISTIFDIYRMFRLAEKVVIDASIDTIHARSYISALAGLKLKNKLGTKFIFDMRGFWADERVDGKLWNLSNPLFGWIYRYFKRKEVDFLIIADYTISLTNAGAKEMLNWRSSERFSPVSVIPCSVDTDLFSPDKIDQTTLDEYRGRTGIDKSHKVLTYLGSIGTWYMLDEMLDFYGELKTRDSSWKFLFLTREKDLVLSAIKTKNLDKNDFFIFQAQRTEVPKYLSLTDWGIFFIRPDYSKISSSPAKQGEMMSMGIPIVTNSGVGDVAEIVEGNNAGVVVDVSLINEGVEKMVQMNYEKSLIRKSAIHLFDLKTAVASYANVYEQTLRK
ncbi:MAG: glycosyltransferase involved in cell wall biosynthesis [Salibacteraceae bacterium]|jgi:glycosyltransferase involved in cell wall biosynthesis